MSGTCFVPGCNRRVPDTLPQPACPIHWAKTFRTTRQRWAEIKTATEYGQVLAQLLAEIEGFTPSSDLEESIKRHPAGSDQ